MSLKPEESSSLTKELRLKLMNFFHSAEVRILSVAVAALHKIKIPFSDAEGDIQKKIIEQQTKEKQRLSEIQSRLIHANFSYLEPVVSGDKAFSLKNFVLGLQLWRPLTEEEKQLPSSEKAVGKEKTSLSLFEFGVDIPSELQELFENQKIIKDTGTRIESLVGYTFSYLNKAQIHPANEEVMIDEKPLSQFIKEKKLSVLQNVMKIGRKFGPKQKELSQEDFQEYRRLVREKRGLLGNGNDPDGKILAKKWLDQFHDVNEIEEVPEDIRHDFERFLYYRSKTIQNSSRMKRKHYNVEVRKARSPQAILWRHVMQFEETRRVLEGQDIPHENKMRELKKVVGTRLDKTDLLHMLEEQASWLYLFCTQPQDLITSVHFSEVIENMRETENTYFGMSEALIEVFYGAKDKNHYRDHSKKKGKH